MEGSSPYAGDVGQWDSGTFSGTIRHGLGQATSALVAAHQGLWELLNHTDPMVQIAGIDES